MPLDSEQSGTETTGATKLQSSLNTSSALNEPQNQEPKSAIGRQGHLKNESTDNALTSHGQQEKEEGEDDSNNIVDFSENDPGDPRNWPKSRKWTTTMIVSGSVFLMPLSSSIVAPSLQTISHQMHMHSDVEAQLVLSAFVLTYCIGPLLLGPLCELFGRIVVLQSGNTFYLIFNLCCGFARNKGELLAFRLLAGIGGSAGLVVGSGIISDCFNPDERGWAIAIYNIGPLIGPSLGAVVGGFVTQYSTWRWSFWATSIFDALLIILGAIFVRDETYRPKILERRKKELIKQTGNRLLQTPYDIENAAQHKSIGQLYRRSLLRPIRLFTTQPIVQVLSLYYAYLYGLMYLVLSTFPNLWRDRYAESTSIGSLNYFALGTGYFIGSQICGLCADRIYRFLKKRSEANPPKAKPEYRLPLMLPASLLIPCGIFMYGWSAQAHTSWIVPDIGIGLFACGAMIGFQCTSAYLIDAYTLYAASATGAVYLLRGFTGFGFPLFGPYLYQSLDYGWGNSVLAFIALGVGVPAPIMLWFWGERLRRASGYAAGGE
ncbi:MFS general substrate transporter [Xylona heveae TC161]|uniref:MFS general substrate transporter n=1 Tax=Xylona heveae (strain CBS 132557 / TC161) TaxID=1328760 RepID=A0A165A250_XYLHT|nr:MFS general substrate transporter [Xylona heveae TC161]KZF19847.1 MFS general substrate transporter [Xylona heveae TC161]